MVKTIGTMALLAAHLNEQFKAEIVEATIGHDLQALFSLDAERGNALSPMFKRDRLSQDDARLEGEVQIKR